MVTPEETEEKCPSANNHCYTNDLTVLVKFPLLHLGDRYITCQYIVICSFKYRIYL